MQRYGIETYAGADLNMTRSSRRWTRIATLRTLKQACHKAERKRARTAARADAQAYRPDPAIVPVPYVS
jgi:hypothetical protein|tara:strand:+ start:639 stop:845 length:207 start_codon:yes stop_codon:yes gene_type:complete